MTWLPPNGQNIPLMVSILSFHRSQTVHLRRMERSIFPRWPMEPPTFLRTTKAIAVTIRSHSIQQRTHQQWKNTHKYRLVCPSRDSQLLLKTLLAENLPDITDSTESDFTTHFFYLFTWSHPLWWEISSGPFSPLRI